MADKSKQVCGHPIECQHYDDDDGFPTCGWCEEVDQVRQTVASLTRCLEDQAVVVREGAVLTLACDTVGYMAQYGGTINMHSGLESIVAKQQESQP